jgi:hypothetical protein
VIRYAGKMYTTLTERQLTTGQRSLLCKMSQGAKVYNGYAKNGYWLNTSMEVSVDGRTLHALVRKGLVKRAAGHVYHITAKGRAWAGMAWNPAVRRAS